MIVIELCRISDVAICRSYSETADHIRTQVPWQLLAEAAADTEVGAIVPSPERARTNYQKLQATVDSPSLNHAIFSSDHVAGEEQSPQ